MLVDVASPGSVSAGVDCTFVGSKMRTFDGALTGGLYTFIAGSCPKNWQSPWHVHHREDEGVYVVEGLLWVKVGEGPFQHVRPGEFAFLPREIPHCYRAVEDTKIVAVCTPAGIEQFFREAATALDDEDFSQEGHGAAAAEFKLRGFNKRYGTEVLGPFPGE